MLKPEGTYIYALIAATKAGVVPPTEDRIKHYKDLEDFVRMILKDVEVDPLGLTAPPGGGAVTGTGTLK